MWLSILMASMIDAVAAAGGRHPRMWPDACARRSWSSPRVKLTWEAAIFRHLLFARMTPLRRSALLLTGELSSVTLGPLRARRAGRRAHAGDAARARSGRPRRSRLVQFAVTTGLLFVACLAGELLERYLFFTACAAPRMPGGIR